ncbi:MAG TPA: hypothetical protein VL285_07510 [Bryobacteraceae bacterium]|nr:hypothetical protein [Bryobacteraceae bacterium]
MTARRKKWLIAGAAILIAAAAGLFFVAARFARRVEPYIREQALQYLRERFDSEVELARLQVHLPAALPFRLLLGGRRGNLAQVEGTDLSLRLHGRHDAPPMLAVKHFSFDVDLGALLDTPKTVNRVTLDGMEIQVPPKGERPSFGSQESPRETSAGKSGGVVIEEVLIRNARLIILPRDKTKVPLRFEIHDVRLESAGKDVAMTYTAVLTNPKPPGEIHSTGVFGPWAAGEPADTPLRGDYRFDNADLGIFNGIAGILRSTGKFEGTLSSITARGEASVPDFRLKSAGNPVPLSTTFEVLVDGTNGNTELKPVVATLGSTHFTTKGVVIKHDGDTRKTIFLAASMPGGRLRDVLMLAMKGPPMMEGTLRLDTTIGIPPLASKVKEKLLLDGTFEITNGKFLRSRIQKQINGLAHRGQGKTPDEPIDQAISRMSGEFKMADQSINFRTLAFAIPGAAINIGGLFDMGADMLDFHGALMLDAKVSQTQTGWKRWVLKPVDPFFSKRGAGTFLHIKVVGSAKDPQFGLDPGGTSPREEAEKAAAAKNTP